MGGTVLSSNSVTIVCRGQGNYVPTPDSFVRHLQTPAIPTVTRQQHRRERVLADQQTAAMYRTRHARVQAQYRAHLTEEERAQQRERIRQRVAIYRSQRHADMWARFCQAPNRMCHSCHRLWYKDSGGNIRSEQVSSLFVSCVAWIVAWTAWVTYTQAAPCMHDVNEVE